MTTIDDARFLLNHTTIDGDDIRQLQAGKAGDTAQVDYCDLALEIFERLAAAEADEASCDEDDEGDEDDKARLQASMAAWRACEEAVEAATSGLDADE